MKNLQEQNDVLKNLVIFLAQCYQKNYDKFASSLTFSLDVKNALGDEKFKIITNVFQHFNTVQGGRARELVEELSTLSYESKNINITYIKEIFGYCVTEARAKIRNDKWTDDAKNKKLKDMQEMWGAL